MVKGDKKTCGIVMPISAVDGCSESHWSDVLEIWVYAILSGPFILYVLNQQSHIDEQYRNIFACFRLRKSLDN